MELTMKDLQKLLRENNQTQQALIEQCRRGDRKAFNQFIQKYQDNIFSHVNQMMGDYDDTFRITCDVFVIAYRSFPKFRDQISIEAWLFKIAERHIRRASGKPNIRWQNLFNLFPKSEQKENQERASLLLQYIDGELSDPEAKLVEERLEKDTAFQREYETLQKTDDLLRFFNQTTAPAELRVYINAKLDEQSVWQKVLDTAATIFQGKAPKHGQISPPSMSSLPTRGPEDIKLLSQQFEMTKGLNLCAEIRRQAEAKYDKADVYKKHGKHNKAIRLLEEALELYQQIEHIEGQILVHHQLALVYKETEKNVEAIQHAQKFLKLYQDLKISKKYEQIQKLLKEIHFP